MPQLINIVGKRFARLLVVSRAPGLTKSGKPHWKCRCDCGSVHFVDGRDLRRGHSRSCGCLRAETAPRNNPPKHGHTRRQGRDRSTPEYLSWKSMIQRCFNPKATGYDRYGACGISVCDRWRLFENFLADMGERPAGHSLDRIDNDGDYEPGNVRWATREQQANNKRPRKKQDAQDEEMVS
jgi:hypothetical protein